MRKYFIIVLLSIVGWVRPFDIDNARDTLVVFEPDSIYDLSNKAIITSQFQLFHNGQLVTDYQLDPVNGRLGFTAIPVDTMIAVASYQYLSGGLPPSVGPGYLQLPLVEEIVDSNRAVQASIVEPDDPIQAGNDDLQAAGTIYRNIELSPLSGTDFSGGLRLQLQGNLGPDIQVNGILTDESLPIQPEGNTQSIDELDQVYLSVTHPYGNVTAGDVEINLQQGRFVSLNRRLTGLTGKYEQGNYSGTAVFAGSKGNYHEMSFKGTDGNQGPYSLTSGSGSRDIIVIAGSERVYLDGQRLMRGENHDYIIDYSAGEIHFTARRLIHSDSDILVEYQYTDLKYPRSISGGELIRHWNETGKIAVSYIREADNINRSQTDLSDVEIDLLEQAGDRPAGISGASSDSTGDYLFIDGIYIYYDLMPIGTEGDRFAVTFQNDVTKGEYIRQITGDGRLYYEYIPVNERNSYQDLYSPVRQLTAPQDHQLLQISAVRSLGRSNSLAVDFAFSDLDDNSFSSRDDSDNLGWGYNLALSGTKDHLPGEFKLGYQLKNWGQSDQFAALQRDRTARFNRDWNLAEELDAGENMLEAGLSLKRRDQLVTNWDLARYQLGTQVRSRNRLGVLGKLDWMPEYLLQVSQVDASDEHLRQINARLVGLPGRFHPYFEYKGEINRNMSQFDEQKGGLIFSGQSNSMELGVGQRRDQMDLDTTLAGLETASTAYFGSLNYKLKRTDGLVADVVIQKHLKESKTDGQTVDFELISAHFTYFNRKSPWRIDSKTRLEETYTESRAIVYDSVGVGLGQYRYDPEFNEYISDINGAYIAYTVLTGERNPTTRFEGIERIEFDFNKSGIDFLQGLAASIELNTEYRGLDFNLNRLTAGNLNDEDIIRARLNRRTEVVYRPAKRKYQFRIWDRNQRDLNGLDPRGMDLKLEFETGGDLAYVLNRELQISGSGYLHTSEINSTVSDLRDRNVDGYWISTGGKLKVERTWQLETLFNFGNDAGEHVAEEFDAQAFGVEINVLRFLGRKGRLRSQINWYNVEAGTAISSLPPEALQGLAIGQSFRASLSGQIMLGPNLNLNINGSYLNDSRYDNFITVNGEIRAFF